MGSSPGRDRIDRQAVREPSAKARARLALALQLATLALIVAAFVLSALQAALRNPNVAQGDQNSFLRLALRIAEGDGFANGNYHPLLALALSPIASRDWRFFSDAKLVNVALAAGALVVIFALGRRLYGGAPALLATAALVFNHELVARAGRTEPEALLTGLFFAAWAVWVLSLARPRLAWLAGALAGLAYMAKGTAQFLLLGYVLYALIIRGPRRWLGRPLAAFVAAYLVAAAPLLITNWRAFGSPFFAFPSTHAMWYDEWDDRYRSADGRHITMGTYIATHTPRQAGERLAQGLAAMPEQWREALRLDEPSAMAAIVLALVLTMTGLWLIGWWKRRQSVNPPDRLEPDDSGDSEAVPDHGLRHGWATFALLFATTYLFFAWYEPIAASPRFFLPLVPIATLLVAATLDRGARHAFARIQRLDLYRVWSALLLPTILALAAGIAIARTEELVRPAEIAASDRDFNAAAIAVLAEAVRTVPAGGTVVWGPGNLATWTTHNRLAFRPVPPGARTLADLEALMREIGATTIILAPDMVRERDTVFAPYFHYNDKQSIRIDALPPGWRMIGAYPDGNCRYCLFEVQQP